MCCPGRQLADKRLREIGVRLFAPVDRCDCSPKKRWPAADCSAAGRSFLIKRRALVVSPATTVMTVMAARSTEIEIDAGPAVGAIVATIAVAVAAPMTPVAMSIAPVMHLRRCRLARRCGFRHSSTVGCRTCRRRHRACQGRRGDNSQNSPPRHTCSPLELCPFKRSRGQRRFARSVLFMLLSKLPTCSRLRSG